MWSVALAHRGVICACSSASIHTEWLKGSGVTLDPKDSC
jgi:hypothetical protein